MRSATTLLCSVLNPARFSESQGENPLPVDAFSKKVSDRKKIFHLTKIWGSCLPPCATTSLSSSLSLLLLIAVGSGRYDKDRHEDPSEAGASL